jgi:uncharacterized phage protein (TIGR01671 family)
MESKEMREIKFRAWETPRSYHDGKMIYQESFVNNTIQYLVNEKTFNNSRIIMQYTGLKDKNGKEIYEGDIINVFDYDTEFLGYGNVIFKYHSWCINWIDSRSECIMKFDEFIENGREINVIGNIYENPELLESE